ncbi:hypothetical protein [Siccibacter turicensis]|nr:hypothetical protein [Siccibacter turicensis]
MKKYFGLICALCFLYSGIVIANSPTDASPWFYDKVSNANVLGKSDPVFIHETEENYKDISLVFAKQNLTITNKTSKNSNICSVEYVSIRKTLSAYFMSTKTTNLYEALYKNNGIAIPTEINLITSVNPDDSCPSPYDEIIAIGDYLTIIDQDYVIFFKQLKSDNEKSDSSRNSNFLDFCRKENSDRIYDGIDSYTCFFPSMSIADSYELLSKSSPDKQGFLRGMLPENDAEYELDGKKIKYHWESGTVLKLTVTEDGEAEIYIFDQQASGANVAIKYEAQY